MRMINMRDNFDLEINHECGDKYCDITITGHVKVKDLPVVFDMFYGE